MLSTFGWKGAVAVGVNALLAERDLEIEVMKEISRGKLGATERRTAVAHAAIAGSRSDGRARCWARPDPRSTTNMKALADQYSRYG